jgi:hypothetical protein
MAVVARHSGAEAVMDEKTPPGKRATQHRTGASRSAFHAGASAVSRSTAATGLSHLGDIMPGLLDDLLQKRAGLNIALIGAWPEICGAHLASRCRPVKISWSRANPMNDALAPATLHVEAEPGAALALQHETAVIVDRINGFFGYAAIDRVRIVQRLPAKGGMRARPPEPTEDDRAEAVGLTAQVEDEALRAALTKLGANVLARQRDARRR